MGLTLCLSNLNVFRASVSGTKTALGVDLEERDFFIDNLLVRIHFVIEMI